MERRKFLIFRKRKKRESFDLEKNLKNIYSENEENTLAGGRLKRRKSSILNTFLLLQFLGIFFLIGIFLVFWFFQKRNVSTEKSLQIQFDLPQHITAGEELQFTLHYRNNESFSLYDVEIILRYPEGFEYIDAWPKPNNEFQNRWVLGDLVEGEEGKITITGRIIGRKGDLVTFSATTVYQPQNFSSIFKEEFLSPTSQITSAILNIAIEGEKVVVPGQEMEYILSYSNTSENDLKNVFLLIDYPKNFQVFSTDPESSSFSDLLDESNDAGIDEPLRNIWIFDSLAKGEDGKIAVKGKFLETNEEKENFTAQIGIFQEKHFTVYQENTLDINIKNHGLKLELSVNNSQKDISVNFSDTLNYTLTLKNIGRETLYDIVLSIELNSEMLQWDTLIDKNAGKRKGNTLIWTRDEIPELGILNPLEEKTVEFSIRLKDFDAVDPQQKNLKTIAVPEAVIGRIGDFEANAKVIGGSIISEINTELELRVEGRYFNDDNIAVGFGPLPPEVGKKTSFRIYWYISNNLNEVNNVVVKTQLSDKVQWEDKFLSTVGVMEYNNEDRTVTWRIATIPPQKSFEEINAWFDVSVIPKESDIGKLIPLIQTTKISAIDTVTRTPISDIARGVTSNLEDDPFGGGRGLVVGEVEENNEEDEGELSH